MPIWTIYLHEEETQKFNEQFLTEQQIEERAVEDKYFRLIELARQYNEDITMLEDNREFALAEIRKKYADEQAAETKENNQTLKEQIYWKII